MPDPLSAALAVIAVATALKDSIETIQVIRDSCSKRPQNYRNAEKLANQVLNTLHGMEETYKEHEATLSKKESLKKAISDLQIEMELVQEECARLIPPVTERHSRTGRIKFAVYSFWNRKKVEQLLVELKDNVYQCSQHFQLLSGIRNEARIIEIHDTVVQSTVHGGSTVVHGHNGSTSTSYSGPGIVTNKQIFTFVQSTPMPMTWIADTIPLRDLSKVYLRREIGRVEVSLQSLLVRLSQGHLADMEIPTFSTTWALEEPLVPSFVVHQDAVVLAIRIQSLLRHSQSNSRISEVDHMMDRLGWKLDDLDMYEDAIAASTMQVNIWREITKWHPSPNTSRHLVHALGNVGACLFNAGDHNQAHLRIKEAINILWSLAAPEPVLHLELKEDIEQNMLLQVLNNKLSSDGSSQLVLDAARMLQVTGTSGLNNLQPGVDVLSPSSWIINSNSHAVELQNKEMSDDDWYTYTYSLLHNKEAHYFEPHDLNKLASMILSHLLVKYPDSDRVQTELVRVLTRLSHRPIEKMDSVALTETREFRNQHLTVLRRLALINPQRYVLDLTNALWLQRRDLLALGRVAEAENAYQDIISLKDLAAAPPHSDLKIPSETEADYYIQLAKNHYYDNHLSDAIYAAQNAISQYSALEFMNPDQSRKKHIDALLLLCRSLGGANQVDAALTEGEKAIKMIEDANIHGSDFDLMDSYGYILDAMIHVLEKSSLPATRTLAQAENINTRIRKLARSGKFKYKSQLARGLVAYVTVLQKNALIKEAIEHLQDLLDNWEKLDLDSADSYISCFEKLRGIFHEEGDIDRILYYSKVTQTTVRKMLPELFGSLEYVSSKLRRLELNHISLLLDVGHHPEALELSKVIVSDICKGSPVVESKDTEALAEALDSLAHVQLSSCMPDDAIATTTKALSLWQKVPTGNDPYTERVIHNRQYSCLLVCMHGLHDIGKVEEALNRLDEAEKMAQKSESVNSMEELGATTIGDGSEYETLLFERSRLLFTKGDYLEAVKLINKVEVIQKEHEIKKSDLAALEFSANILSYSRILYCTLGRHEEGLAAATELAKLKDSIRESSPGRARVMDIRLDRMTRRGAWKSVQDAKERLTCTHQNDF